MPQRNDSVLRLIAIFKLLKGTLLVAAAVAAFLLAHGGSARLLELQPGNRHLSAALTHVCALSPRTDVLAGLALLVYAALFLTEGVGLMLRAVWAEYLTTIITASFLPIEVYEIVEHGGAVKIAALVINIAIVIYLVLRLRRDGRWPFSGGGSSSSYAA